MSLAIKIQQAWSHCQKTDPKAFNQLIAQLTPYSGSVKPQILALEPGYCQIAIKETKALQNPFNSVHAVALINVAELAGGLAMMMGLPNNTRAIITELQAKYYKKARGKLIAECRCDVPTSNQVQSQKLHATIFNQENEMVAELFATWQLGPESTE